ncbi:MAG: hypothetical protein A2504_07075 [Bdellovibrionales bacterium RIFOXYD12_FULL_39_22]|nr:MAG: hypothetical protein A2385_05290 [Bdellovibrionales bacterium RIFOXYB1_FULL_39_21]OFZ44337.1 MAG: hypothetical protein A2485_16070 [Bdellovibrionales bacterium RIFOXYC12_FULL_39_17]OFZ49192.1 MAG: hypothetical protein A2404_16010 [Bdellovibrionales bacterium RIFOXYC1_FULL_39_130]OFZ77000.1 MAG: hypothetical protein A2560_11095 [Bdellovibrionales bacterium RIFOXYD1_FULL_39_84]OFZ95213.1 MAG: hypothetical protein A2504_07075 [Bdellovibrionales bacterium RIFOXYD12_FULL_39_22]HLE09634.1 HA
MKINIFQKYFIFAIASVITFIVLGFYFNMFLTNILAHPSTLSQMPSRTFMAKLVDRLAPVDKVSALQELEKMQEGQFWGPTLVLLDASGNVLYPKEFKINIDWNKVIKPQRPYEVTIIQEKPEKFSHSADPFAIKDSEMHPPPPWGPWKDMMSQSNLIRLAGEPAMYLYEQSPLLANQNAKARINWQPPRPPSPFWGTISLLVSLILGIAVTLSAIYYSVNKNVKQADLVISELQKGNLKARFQVTRKDEFGQAMLRFNHMADEIEKLVEHLKSVERARTKLLQELAHDLRTPITSLKNLLETLSLKGDRLDQSVKTELITLSLREVEYFERLVEDLLFLAKVEGPKYQQNSSAVLIGEVLQEEIDQVFLRHKHQGSNIKIISNMMDMESEILADDYLLHRLFRNALENAHSFAVSEVQVSCVKDNGNGAVIITIDDDGPGFSLESLKAFGERRFSRQLQKDKNGRLSVGLGSVVMKTICNAYDAKLKVSNRIDSSGKIVGAHLEIAFSA